ncbi:aminotransferase class I/II-fold pyridoxal phosphate-dependent enzyme [Calidifontibacter sp. DB0510]|uniref:cysteine-S-conjugate beta-lyase n=2 Tax=Metallococcus carri TaxID=1656884 RepID=A0A967AZP9_9MICO|nr:aminotransferase class I/II-fold pyridoxal phosphate-dependent enzyme [Metallococcus carri]NOP37130.1 aminotransferase class I/II-fold pyridoxal phosphate-dependent enzyme [Calidifontibacter sp. DB2511S]
MDVRIAEPIAARLHRAIDDSDLGYAGEESRLVEAFAGFAQRRWGWDITGARTWVHSDLADSGSTVLRSLAGEGGGVIITTPVYNAFFHWLERAGVRKVEVPLLSPETGGRLDLQRIAERFAAGDKVLLLSHPHNPTGVVHPREDLVALAELAAAHEAYVVADEIHAPLTYPGVDFVPYLTVSDAARRTGVALHSASKSWNLAGLKSSLVIADPDGPKLPALSVESTWSSGILGMLAAEVAFAEGEPWLDVVRAALAERAAYLQDKLPTSIGYHPPSASYLAWLDLRDTGLPGEPAREILRRTDLFISAGPLFGELGAGWARLNFATSYPILDDAIDRIIRAIG